MHLSSAPVTLPFESASFDAVLSLGVLEHVAHTGESLDELRRVLEPGGTLYVFKLPNRYSYLERLAKLIGLYYHGANPDEAVYTKRSALALVESHGFQITEFRRAKTCCPDPRGGAPYALARVAGLNLVATNLELVATALR